MSECTRLLAIRPSALCKAAHCDLVSIAILKRYLRNVCHVLSVSVSGQLSRGGEARGVTCAHGIVENAGVVILRNVDCLVCRSLQIIGCVSTDALRYFIDANLKALFHRRRFESVIISSFESNFKITGPKRAITKDIAQKLSRSLRKKQKSNRDFW